MKKIICLLLSIVMLLGVASLAGCSKSNVWSAQAFDTEKKSNYNKKDEIIAEKGDYVLMWRGSDCTVDLLKKRDATEAEALLADEEAKKAADETYKYNKEDCLYEYRWGATARTAGELTEDPVTGMPIPKNPKVSSLLYVETLRKDNYNEEDVLSATDAVQKGRVVTEKIDSGIKVEFYFDAYEFMVPVEVTLRDNGSVAMKVDPNLIQENQKYEVIAVSIAPFWCTALNGEENSYLFIPDGSGALINTASTSQSGADITLPVYGFDPVMYEENKFGAIKEARLPVYGAKRGDAAALAIIEENSESTKIEAKVGSKTFNYSGIYSTVQIRGYSKNHTQQMNNKKTRNEVYSKSMIQTPVTVGFYPLTGEKASYSGMAEAYKNYLSEKGLLTETDSETALNLTFIGGVMIDKTFAGIPYTDLLAATTLDGVQNIVGDLAEKTKAKMSVKLLGFGSTGAELGNFAGGFTIHKNIGSASQLSKLNSFCADNKASLYFDFDIVKLNSSSAGYSNVFDTAYNAVGKIGKGYKYDVVTRGHLSETAFSLLKREELSGAADKLLSKVSKWNLSGLSMESLSSIAYSDYSTGTTDYFEKNNMDEDVNAIYAKFKDKGYKVASDDANAYAALASNIVFDTPTQSSQYYSYICDVPFYQMVFKGYVPMSGESINHAVNPTREFLKAVEAGIGLNYTVTENYYNEFIDYQGYYFFNSKYDDIAEDIVKNSTVLADYYSAIDSAKIVSNDTLTKDGSNGLRETVFDNGVKVYVNYTDVPLTTPSGKTVDASGFVWEK